jgi:hypothetical protein
MKRLMILSVLCACSPTSSSSLSGVGAFTPNTQLSQEVLDAGFGAASFAVDMAAIASGVVDCSRPSTPHSAGRSKSARTVG